MITQLATEHAVALAEAFDFVPVKDTLFARRLSAENSICALVGTRYRLASFVSHEGGQASLQEADYWTGLYRENKFDNAGNHISRGYMTINHEHWSILASQCFGHGLIQRYPVALISDRCGVSFDGRMAIERRYRRIQTAALMVLRS